MKETFFTKLEKVCREKNTLLCIGLDPRVSPSDGESAADLIIAQNKKIIEETAPYAACFKPNIAFYEIYGPEGLKALEETLNMIPDDIPVIMDSKRGDIGSTAEAYADSIFGHYKVGSTTLSPYMGRDAVDPFLKWEDRGVFLLCRTSNPSAGAVQDLMIGDKTVYEYMASELTSWSDRVGLVVAGNDIPAMAKVRDIAPDAWFLAPGIGAQGGDMKEAVEAGMREDGLGILPNVSRAVSNAPSPGEAARKFRDEMNEARDAVLRMRKSEGYEKKDFLMDRVVKGLIDTQCFKVGEFVLKSGKKSPFYIDIRRVSSSVSLLNDVAEAFAKVLEPVEYDRIAGIPVAALPLATAVSLKTGKPMIYPRITMKAHGTGNRIEGEYNKGEKIVLLDDLITTGKSKVEAIEILREAGLVVDDLVVLLERGAQGRKDMAAAEISLHAYAHVSELLAPCHKMGLIDEKQFNEMTEYALKE
ncbi:orotidine-5'-phosphate decarboxylase [Spirochaeta isovalerica]|uniref:Orotate phosphoribosyltransferase n=1 Tax=Spirochaeta isovalerica TaxID=150 RepID=A0A841R3H9_9SPIO|nr:orotidine-5'-phosphate decarboxylase [Spirochaeta isovalerica]MBB6478376.1 uridine monophosphate synthetase [Spirochaeta isovalerica]